MLWLVERLTSDSTHAEEVVGIVEESIDIRLMISLDMNENPEVEAGREYRASMIQRRFLFWLKPKVVKWRTIDANIQIDNDDDFTHA